MGRERGDSGPWGIVTASVRTILVVVPVDGGQHEPDGADFGVAQLLPSLVEEAGQRCRRGVVKDRGDALREDARQESLRAALGRFAYVVLGEKQEPEFVGKIS